MAKPSAFLQQIEARHRAELRLQRLFTMQQCEDMALIAANETFGFGPERSARLRQVIREVFRDWAILAVEDGRSDKDIEYTKGKLDERLQKVLGPYFIPWEERYPEVGR